MHFDLHTHVSLKTMLGGTKNTQRKDCWTVLKSPLLDPLTQGVISSQSSLRQMEFGQVFLAISAIYSLERPVSKNWKIKLGAILEKHLSRAYLNKILNNTLSPYRNALDEIEHLKAAQNAGMKVVQQWSQIKEGRINLVLCVEGAHSFQDKYVGDTESLKSSTLKNLHALKEKERLLYVSPIHLTRNLIGTHAYAMKLIKDIEFAPKGFGMTSFGEEFVEHCYKKNNKHGKRTFVDIKHMSLKSRLDFYQFRKDNGYSRIPIIASHIGVTGRSYKSIRVSNERKVSSRNYYRITHHDSFYPVEYYEQNSPIQNYCELNAWTLNLHDEEFLEIIDSGGLMGMILDERVLGAGFKDEGEEIISEADYEYLKQKGYVKDAEDSVELDAGDDFANSSVTFDPNRGDRGIKHLFANIIHIVKTYATNNSGSLKAWDHIVLGTDSDGLIRTIERYANASQFPSLKNELFEVFEEFRYEGRFKKYFGTFETKTLIDKLFFKNGHAFVKKHL